jgi:hypothetical protein
MATTIQSVKPAGICRACSTPIVQVEMQTESGQTILTECHDDGSMN